MKLYHGTSEEAVRGILESGIRPRPADSTGNWAHTVVSHPDRVYLTSGYALYFGWQAKTDEGRIAVLEVETYGLKKKKMLPDEDFLAQVFVKADPKYKGRDLLEVTAEIDPREYQRAWEYSLEKMGTVAYSGIVPPSSIKRIAYIKPDPEIILAGCDPLICLDNFMIMGEYYKSLMTWVFEGTPPVPLFPKGPEYEELWSKLWNKNVEVSSLSE